MAAHIVRRFHEVTEHAPRSPSRGGPFDPAIEPATTKRYVDATRLPLPTGWNEPTASAASVLSGEIGPAMEMDLAAVARLLFLGNGITRRMRRGGRVRHFRAAPSAGALYPIELYVVCGDLAGLPAGIHHYEPVDHVLQQVRPGDHRGTLAAATADDSVASRPASLLLTGIPWRTTWKYGPRGYRHLFWDAGVIVANILAAATAVSWRADVLAGFVDAEVSRLLDLGDHLPFIEWPLAAIALGGPDGAASHAETPEPRRLDVEPLSPTVIHEPELEAVHHAGDLPSATAVADWRASVHGAQFPDAAANVATPEGMDTTVDEVILRRGSTRAFDPDTVVPTAVLGWGLAAAMRPIPGDLAPHGHHPVVPLVAVHAVEGVASAGYRWTPRGLDLVVADQPRQATAHLCLDQRLGGTAAATTFLSSHLDALLSAGGARGYRVAQLAAGVSAGSLQLAAFALGLGGTGLTFYDDEIRRWFATDADPMLVTAVGRPAYRRGHSSGRTPMP